jgi:hypothetical protein
MEQQHSRSLTRREAIKRGAAFGAGVVWAVPTVQAIGMSRAFASETSPDTDCIYYAIKIEQKKDGDGNVISGYVCEPISEGGAQCFDPDDFFAEVLPGGCDRVQSASVDPDENGDDWVITLKPGCEFVENESYVQIKAGSGPTACSDGDPVEAPSGTYTFSNDTDPAISHIEAIICCNPNG